MRKRNRAKRGVAARLRRRGGWAFGSCAEIKRNIAGRCARPRRAFGSMFGPRGQTGISERDFGFVGSAKTAEQGGKRHGYQEAQTLAATRLAGRQRRQAKRDKRKATEQPDRTKGGKAFAAAPRPSGATTKRAPGQPGRAGTEPTT